MSLRPLMTDRSWTRLLLAMIASLLFAPAGEVRADPDEAWLVRAPVPAGTRPLLVIVLDTSAAMAERIAVTDTYDPLKDYAAASGAARQCNPQRVYWRQGPGPPPDCASMSGFASGGTTTRGMQCEGARDALARHGYFAAARAAQWHPAGYWGALRADSTEDVECRSDRGRHGRDAGPWFATNGRSGPWNAAPAGEIDWDASPLGASYIFYSGNYLNFLAAGRRTIDSTAAEAAAARLIDAVEATDELDVGLIRTTDGIPDAQGGFVLLAPTSAASAAARLPALLSGISGSGAAPIAETMTEAVAWLSGASVHYGDDARADGAARNPRDPARYQSPFLCPCRPVTIAIVTAGTPSQDDDARQPMESLPGFLELTGGCDGSCVPAVAQWLTQSDLSAELPGRQFASLSWIAPSPEPALVAASIDRAGGIFESLDDPLAFANVVARSLQHDAAIAAGPQLSAASLLQADDSTHAPAVIYGLSVPQPRARWLGNLLRYRLSPPESPVAAPVVMDRNGQPAIDPETGLPRQGSRSEWSDQPDGDSLLTGSAAGRLPDATSRRIFSNVTADILTSARNRLTPGNRMFSAAVLGLGLLDNVTPDAVIDWLLNQRLLGDPGLQAPVAARGTGADGDTLFFATQDGLLHALDADTGVERWAFIPANLLKRVPELMRDETGTTRSHGIDGPLVLHRYDPNGDGRIDPSAGEHLWLLFGLGRGGGGYYALDVASPDEPRLLWTLGPAELGGSAESWAAPVVSRLAVAGSGQSSGFWIVALAGGYDRVFDFPGLPAASSGATLSIHDAGTGRRLWRASGSVASGADLQVPGLDVSLASAPRILDMDGDGYADRLYIVDVAGGLWRMDLSSGAAAADLVRARLVARLGDQTQRFYASPDISVVHEPRGLQLAISIGSGWLAKPRDAEVTDRIYSIRDREQPSAVLHDQDLHDATDGVTAMPPGAPGWFVRLDAHGSGEKVIGSSLTFDHRLHFQTYQPAAGTLATACGPPLAVRRLRAFDLRSGLPDNRLKLPGDPDEHEFEGSGLPAALRFGFPGTWEAACPGCRARPFGIVGGKTFDAGFANDPVRTSWRKLPIDADSL